MRRDGIYHLVQSGSLVRPSLTSSASPYLRQVLAARIDRQLGGFVIAS